MNTAARSYVIRLSSEGKRQLERDLKSLGFSGEKSLKMIGRAAKPASDGLHKAKVSAHGFRDGLRSVSAELPALQRVSRFLGTTALAGGLVAFGRSSLDVAKNFQSSMKRVEAVLRASGSEMEALSAKALEMGATTAFTASQAADGIEVLAKNGLATSQILGGALDGTLALAAALGGELAPSADLITDLMQQFNLEASQLPAIADALAGAALTSKFGFDDLRLAIAQAGGVAGTAGLEYQDLLTSLSASAYAFASGSDAGTSFKTFLQRLVPQSKAAKQAIEELGLEFFDADGNMRSMSEIAEELKTGLAGLSDEARNGALVTIFGTDAIRTAAALAATGGDGFRDLAEGISQVSAQEQAQVRMQGLEGALRELSAAWEALQLEAANSGGLELAETAVDRLTAALRFLTENFEEVEEVAERVAQALVTFLVGRGISLAIARGIAMRAAYIELAGSVSGVGTAATRAMGPLARLGVAGRALTGVLGGPLGLALTAASILSLGLDVDTAADAIENADAASDQAASALEAYAAAARQAAEDQDKLSGKISATTAEMVRQGRVAVQTALEEAQRAQQELLGLAQGEGLFNGDHIGRMLADTFQVARAEFVRQRKTGLQPEFNVDTQQFENLGPVFDDMFEALSGLRDGTKSFTEVWATLQGIAGAGQEVTSIISLFDDALNGVADVDLESVRERMRGIAGDIGLFQDELDAISAAQTESEVRSAYDALRTSMLNAAAAGKRLRETSEDGLLALVERAAEGEITIEDLKAALDGTWAVAQEKPEGTFAGQIADDAERAVSELEKLEQAHASITRRQEAEGGSTDRGSYQRAEIKAAQQGILDLIAMVEGTDKGRGYNETLGYGAFTGGPVNLINMTLNEILELQKRMLQHPDNTFNSSAVGRYQIVRTTLQDLMKNLDLSGDELFDSKLQDRLATELVRRRMPQGREGFYNEWEGFKVAGTPWSTIQTGLGSQSIPRLDPGVQRANEAAAEQRLRLQKEQEQTLRDLILAGDEQLAQLELEEQLIGKSAAEQARLKYIHQALAEAKRAGINVEQAQVESGERLIDVIYRQADAIAARTAAEEGSRGVSDDDRVALEESKDAVRRAFDELKAGGEGWTGFIDTMLDHMVDKLWEAAFDPVWDYLGGLLNDLISGLTGGGGGGGILGAIFGGGKAAGGELIPKRAYGGNLTIGGQAQGLMQGVGHRRQDNILFWGSSGEFIQPGDAVDYYGADFMEAIRQKRLPRHAAGGALGGPVATGANYPALTSPLMQTSAPQAMMSGGVTKVEISVNVEGVHGREDIDEAVQTGIGHAMENLEKMLPDKVLEIQNDPKVRS
ncbi:phage tail tape measure protein [Tritonibacter mobilis]|uniref:phage tail tape measure protein n=1 Tax=Tritonibacter mobilis TaxID=379347 RepID=UPI000806E1E2|nr:phage tail tape measure protein [Tritonibacter mobilis]